MTIYNALKIGDHHINHCEDYLIISGIDKSKLICAVMDGCSMGTDSYLASTLTGKLLRKISKELSYKQFIQKESISLPQLLENIISQLLYELRQLKNSLHLERDEVLNTLLIAVIDINDKSGEFLCIGDGLICINDQFFEFEQDDKPDYFGYHLEDDFITWYNNQKQRVSASGIKNFSLATDGIFTFKKFDNKTYHEAGNVIDLLLLNTDDWQNQNMLDKKLFEIQTDWGLRPTDDLAIIRGIL